MILFALALQAAEAPDLSGAAWQYVGRSDHVAHYADANSARRDGSTATITYRFIQFRGSGDDRVTRMRINCAENYAVEGPSFAVTAEGLQRLPPSLLTPHLPGDIYRHVGNAIALACNSRAAHPVSDPVRDARTEAAARPAS